MTKVKIYQLDKNNEEAKNVMFLPYSFIGNVKENNYNLVYKMEVSEPINDENEKSKLLESLFVKFNIDRPIDFEGHSLSISDVIELNDRYFYVDSIGFTDITDEWRNSIIKELEDIIEKCVSKANYLITHRDMSLITYSKHKAFEIYIKNKNITKEKAIGIAYSEILEWFKQLDLMNEIAEKRNREELKNILNDLKKEGLK